MQENHLHTHNFITHLSLAHLKSSVRFTFISLLKPAIVDDLGVKNQANEQSMFPTHSITQHEAHIRIKDLLLYPGRRSQTKNKLQRETENHKMEMVLFASAKKNR